MRLFSRTEAAGFFLLAPYFARNLTKKKVLRAQVNIGSMLDLVPLADPVMIGIESRCVNW